MGPSAEYLQLPEIQLRLAENRTNNEYEVCVTGSLCMLYCRMLCSISQKRPQVDIEPADRALVVQGAEDHAGSSPLQVPEDSSERERRLLHGSLSRAGAGERAGVRASTGARGLSQCSNFVVLLLSGK